LPKKSDLNILIPVRFFRSIAVYFQDQGINEQNEVQRANALNKMNLTVEYMGKEPHIFLDGKDVTNRLPLQTTERYVSKVSPFPDVRLRAYGILKGIASTGNFVVDGRAMHKVFTNPLAAFRLEAEFEERVRRIFLRAIANGENVTYEEVYADAKQREERDQKNGRFEKSPIETVIVTTNITANKVSKIMKKHLLRTQSESYKRKETRENACQL